MKKILRNYVRQILQEEYQSHTFEPRLGDPVINVNKNCKHYGSEGVVKDISDLSDDVGKVIVYIVTNDGDEYSIGDVLEKTMDQLAPLEGFHESRSISSSVLSERRTGNPAMQAEESALIQAVEKFYDKYMLTMGMDPSNPRDLQRTRRTIDDLIGAVLDVL